MLGWTKNIRLENFLWNTSKNYLISWKMTVSEVSVRWSNVYSRRNRRFRKYLISKTVHNEEHAKYTCRLLPEHYRRRRKYDVLCIIWDSHIVACSACVKHCIHTEYNVCVIVCERKWFGKNSTIFPLSHKKIISIL